MDRTKILFVCSQNKWRSLTAEKICEKISGYSARSAGTEKGARIRVTEGLIGWADLIFVMEKKHGDRLRSKFPDSIKDKEVICLQIPDNYRYMEPELVELLQAKLSPYIEIPDREIHFMQRVLEPEVMDSWEEAIEYDSMDFTEVNAAFAKSAAALGPVFGNVLDAGTGTARIPIALTQLRPEWKLTCIDLSANMLKVAAQNVEKAGVRSQISLELIDAKAMPYPDNSFDMVISNSIIHHLPDPLPFLQEVRRVLKPNGAIFLRDLLRPETVEIRDNLVQMYAGDCNSHQKQLFSDSLQAAFTLGEVEEMIRNAGLDGLRIYESSDRHWTAERAWRESV
ncbi:MULTISPECIES: methyltransferase domain-containing protein [unclassified Microcoleus]|uniref:methyltransferase domain-containing protein n=1 Tax=unclassified Microcoleus TaxID=2642155 RepID=UPI0025EF8DE3|nr:MULTISPECIES: methyltransferase domain-containing protein [unclassified Microcoleus]